MLTKKQINQTKRKYIKPAKICKNIYRNMKIYKYIEMYVERYLFEIIKKYIKTRKYKNI